MFDTISILQPSKFLNNIIIALFFNFSYFIIYQQTFARKGTATMEKSV